MWVSNRATAPQAEYVTTGVLDIKPGGGLHCTSPDCMLTITGFRHVSISAGSGVSSHTLSMAVPRITVSGNVYAVSLKVWSTAPCGSDRKFSLAA